MAVNCRESGCSNPPEAGGDYCDLHECFLDGCHAHRPAADRVYCPTHEAIHYAKTGRYAFACRAADCPYPREPDEDYCEAHLSDGSDEPTELASDQFPLATKILQATAMVVVLVIGFWALFSWLGSSGQQAGPKAPKDTPPPIGAKPIGEGNDEVRDLERALDTSGYR